MRNRYHVRPLVWRTNGLGTYGELGNSHVYGVDYRKGIYTLRAELDWRHEDLGDFKSVRAYKEAAQNHFEKCLVETILKKCKT